MSPKPKSRTFQFCIEFRPSLASCTLGGTADSAQVKAVAKLIQRIDNLSASTCQALQPSPRFTYQKAQFGKVVFVDPRQPWPRARLVKGKNT